MFEALNEQLLAVKVKLRARQKLKKVLPGLEFKLHTERKRLDELQRALEKETTDVAQLEGLSLKGLYLALRGNKETQLEQERQEMLHARLKMEQGRQAVAAREQAVNEVREQLRSLGQPEWEYQALMKKKEALLAASEYAQAPEVMAQTEALVQVEAALLEVKEARNAGHALGTALADVTDLLKSAKGFGVWDMAGGGIVATALKHAKIDEAQQQLQRVQELFVRFNRELADLDMHSGSPIQIDTFSTFADYFLDGLLFDWIVQSKINEAMGEVVKIQTRVAGIMGQLNGESERLHAEAETIRQKRQTLLEEI